MFKKSIHVTLFVVFLLGCARTDTTLTYPPSAFTPSPLYSTATETLTINQSIVDRTPVLSDTPYPIVTKKCTHFLGLNLLPPTDVENNRLLLRNGQSPRQVFIINLTNGENVDINVNHIVVSTYISPAWDKFAYAANNKIVIANPDGKILMQFAMSHDTETIQSEMFWGWLDNSHITWSTQKKEITPDTPREDWLPSLVILNIEDGSQVEMKSLYPGIDNIDPYMGWPLNRVIYDSSLSYAVYPSDYGTTVTLFYRPEEKVVIKVAASGGNEPLPRWMPGEKYLVVAGHPSAHSQPQRNQDFFLVDKKGNIKRLTYMEEQWKDIGIDAYSISPDGQRIAFWYRFGYKTEQTLGIYNLNTKVITDFCVKNQQYGAAPVWSADSKYVMVSIQENTKYDSPLKIVWINPDTGSGDILSNMNAFVIGWLLKP